MGNSCYYLGVKRENEAFVKGIIEEVFEKYLFIYLIDDIVEFKQPMPILSWDNEESTEKIIPMEDEIFLVLQGDRYPLRQGLNKILETLEESHHYAQLIPLDYIDTDLYLNEYKEKDWSKPFENDYVKIY